MIEREKAMSVACPWCSAKAGEECISIEAEVLIGVVHAGRIVRSVVPLATPPAKEER